MPLLKTRDATAALTAAAEVGAGRPFSRSPSKAVVTSALSDAFAVANIAVVTVRR